MWAFSNIPIKNYIHAINMRFAFFSKVIAYFFPPSGVSGDDGRSSTESQGSNFSMGTIRPRYLSDDWIHQQLQLATPTSPTEITVSPVLGPDGTIYITWVEWWKLLRRTAVLWPSEAISVNAPGGIFEIHWVGSFKILEIHGIIGDRMFLTVQYVFPFERGPFFLALRQQHDMPRATYIYYLFLGLRYYSVLSNLEHVPV